MKNHPLVNPEEVEKAKKRRDRIWENIVSVSPLIVAVFMVLLYGLFVLITKHWLNLW